MTHLELIKQLDNKSNHERLDIIIATLNHLNVKYVTQEYSTGKNLIVDLGDRSHRVGISSHFDRVKNSAGANDNGSAIAVCIDIIQKFKNIDNNNIGLRVFFFDEEETGLKGSKAYVQQFGVKDLLGLSNLELVGLGDKYALWPVGKSSQGRILSTFERVSETMHITTKRFDRIVTNTADHISFQKAGLEDSFTVTCISDEDIETAIHYYKALEFEVDRETLAEIMSNAPIFQHYHKPTDTFEKLNENSLITTSSIVWNTIAAMEW